MLERFIILGATGDLTARYLLPALVELRQQGLLPDGIWIGVGREAMTNEEFRKSLANRLAEHRPDLPEATREEVVSWLEYRQADVTNHHDLQAIIGQATGQSAVYLALPPAVHEPVLKTLASIPMCQHSRIVIEKPFGQDLASAKRLNGIIRSAFAESTVFRMDHFLGMQTVQNILGLRFGNRVFEYLWNREHIERVEIVWDETVALEGRAGYYDATGALRDMVQNHLLQLLCVVAMEVPVSLDERDFRDRKVDVLRAVRRLTPEEIVTNTTRGRYTAGQIGERRVPSYVEEEGVDPGRGTETFAQVRLFVDNWRWAGVPFVLRTGKALARDRHEVMVVFRPVPHLAFSQGHPRPNYLRLRLNPDRVELGLNLNGLSAPLDQLDQAKLAADFPPQELSAYARLLLDVFEGNAVLSIRGDEAEESWRIVEPIQRAWAEGAVPLLEYPAGSTGPDFKQ
ncbi:MAG: glucose-6-phosphate dehydrogenase [Gemmataceae bacterium]|nr:glucose-6-phosphate dehydrogenase [Gemmataceae bacterium]